MAHPKNSKTQDTTQQLACSQPEIRGFTYYAVHVEHDDLGFTQSWEPFMVGGLATELYEMLKPLYPKANVYVQVCAGWAGEFDRIRKSADRHKDIVLSCRHADHPGHTYLERVSMRRESPAPQKPTPAKRGAGGAAC